MTSPNLKVGIFVLLGLVVGGILIFIVGEERMMFRSKASLHASFRDVAGLRVGSPVRMGGVDVGQVTGIEFTSDPRDMRLRVTFTVTADNLRRVRRDSVARIASKGLLGDKAIDLSIGTAGQPPVPDGGTVRGVETDDIGNALAGAATAVTRANEVLSNVAAATRPFANARFSEDVSTLVHDLRLISHQAATGPGLVHEVLTDPESGRRFHATLASLQSTADRLSATAGHVEALAREARTGPGMLHALVYDRQGETMVRNLARAADELGAITHDVRTGNGGLHRIIYGTDSAEAVANLNGATRDLQAILRDVRAGRGTVGALLVDPSLYEDLKTLVGDVQRNEILRALVRYSIHQDESRRAAPPPQPSEGPRAP